MAIEKSVKGITDFLQDNEDLVKDIQNAAKSIRDLGDQLDQHRKDAETALAAVKNTAFAVSGNPDTKKTQADLLKQIENISGRILESQNDPIIAASLLGDQADLYMRLGNTYNDLVGQIVTFTRVEVDELKGLLQQATLDAAARQRQADLLAGAVQISKFALKFALKLAA